MSHFILRSNSRHYQTLTITFASINSKFAAYGLPLGLQRGGTFPVSFLKVSRFFGNFSEFFGHFWIFFFFTFSETFGKFPEIQWKNSAHLQPYLTL